MTLLHLMALFLQVASPLWGLRCKRYSSFQGFQSSLQIMDVPIPQPTLEAQRWGCGRGLELSHTHYPDHTPRGRGRLSHGDIWGCRVVGRRNGSKEPVSQNDCKKVSKLGSARAWELLPQSSPEISRYAWWPPSIRLKTQGL